jgi:hypothetical protein
MELLAEVRVSVRHASDLRCRFANIHFTICCRYFAAYHGQSIGEDYFGPGERNFTLVRPKTPSIQLRRKWAALTK